MNHHIDRRATDIAAEGAGNPDDLLNTRQTAGWLGLSEQWLESGRHYGYGPPFVRLSARCVRYRRGAVLAWLAERSHRATSEYARRPSEDADAA